MNEAQLRAIKKYRNNNREKYNEYQREYRHKTNLDETKRSEYNEYMNVFMKRKYAIRKEYERLRNIEI